MSKPQPIWQELPLYFKKDVVGILDLQSRFCLGLCSKSDQSLVNRTPLFVEKLTISVNGPENKVIMSIESHDKSSGTLKLLQNPIDQILRFLTNTKISVKHIRFHDFGTDEEMKINLILELAQKTQGSGILLNSETFSASGVNGQQYLTLLKCFDPKMLRQSEVERFNCLPGDRDEIIETEQWKQLNIFGRSAPMKCDVFRTEDFLHMMEIHLTWSSATPSAVWKVIQNFVDRDVPYHAGFKIQLNMSLKMENIIKNPGPIIKNGYYRYHILKLPMPSAQNALIVRFYLRQTGDVYKVNGMVSHMEQEDSDEKHTLSRKGLLMRHLVERYPDRVDYLETD